MSAASVLLLAGAAFAWLMMLHEWHGWLDPRLDARVKAPLARGERPMPIRGLAKYEHAEVAAKLYRAEQVLPWERGVGFGIAFGVPLAATLAVLWSL